MKTTAMIVAAACLLLAGAAAACSNTSDLEDDIDALNARVDVLTAAAERNAVLNAVDILDSAALHEIDEEANENDTIVAGAAGAVTRAYIAVESTEWPAELQPGADEMAAALLALLEALEAEDLTAVAEAGATAHEVQHGFSEDVQNYIREQAGLPVEEHEEEPAEGTPAEGTPAEGETPAAGGTPTEGAEAATPTTAG
jgi:hypothetical protein